MNVAILGAGNIARCMATAVNGLDDNYVAYAVASRDLEKAESFAKEWGFEKAYGSYEEMLADEKVDLVYIATPHSHHYEHAKLCIAAGKNMLVEKAFTANTAQAEEILAAAKEKGVLITEAIWTRYMPSRQMIMDLIESGIIGEVTMLSANLCYPIENVERMRNPALAGGTLLDLGVYPINFASMVFGDDIEDITGHCVKIDTGMDAQETITIRYKDGKVANIFSSMLVAADRSGMIYGKKGYIQVQNINNPEMIRVYDVEHNLVKEIPVPEQINGYEYEVIACKKALDEGKLECPEMPHAETIQIMKYMDTLRKLWGIKYPFE